MGGRRAMPREAEHDVLPAGTSVRVKGLRNDRQLNDAQVRLCAKGNVSASTMCAHSHSSRAPILLFAARVRSRSTTKLPSGTQ
jgi:hypothetical protein|eukprot:COSAG02_NODE_40_length_47766_cov_88.053119_10_plen_83_part_00